MKQFSLFLFSLTSSLLFAQKVESATYDFVLQELLIHNVPEVSVQEIDLKQSNVFLDARTYEEYQVSHLPHAIWIGYDDFRPDRISDLVKNKAVVVYCSVGYRSEKITKKLIDLGFSARNLYGGIFEWKNQKMMVYDSKGIPTEQVHAFDRVWGVWLLRGEKVYE